MEKLSRDELNRRLEALRKTRNDEESYSIIQWNRFAMCYSTSPWKPRNSCRLRCNKCGNQFEKSYGRYANLVNETYEHARKFERVGLESTVVFYCDECAMSLSAANCELWLKNFDDDQCHASTLIEDEKLPHSVTRSEYNIVLKFLSKSISNDFSYNSLISERESIYRRDAGPLKVKIDVALTKVLGVTIEYDKAEAHKLLEALMVSKRNESGWCAVDLYCNEEFVIALQKAHVLLDGEFEEDNIPVADFYAFCKGLDLNV